MEDNEAFDTIHEKFDETMQRLGFKDAEPYSHEWEVAGHPWIKENGRTQIWVYLISPEMQRSVMGTAKNHYSIYAHIQRGRILDKFELKPRSIASLKAMIPTAIKRIEEYNEQLLDTEW